MQLSYGHNNDNDDGNNKIINQIGDMTSSSRDLNKIMEMYVFFYYYTLIAMLNAITKLIVIGLIEIMNTNY